MRLFSVLLIGFSIFAAACEDPAANKPRALVEEPGQTRVERDNSEGEVLRIDPSNSKIEFIGSKVTGKHDGGFEEFSGSVTLVNEKPEDSAVNIQIEMASVYTDADGLTIHLRTKDFFLVEQYPRSTFSSTKIVPDSEKGAGNYLVTGDFELRGVKKSITFPATITISDSEVTVSADFKINRKDFGVNYPGQANDLIRDDVAIMLDLKAPRNK